MPPLHRRGARALPLSFLLVLLAAPAPALGPGDPAPTWSAPALLGKSPVSLTALRGKVVYLDFWASWCAPCRTSLPLLESLRREFPADDFAVVAVNVDREPEAGRRFLSRAKVGYPSASDPEGRIPASFGVETMPTSYLIDRQGVIRWVHRGFQRSDVAELRARISELVER